MDSILQASRRWEVLNPLKQIGHMLTVNGLCLQLVRSNLIVMELCQCWKERLLVEGA